MIFKDCLTNICKFFQERPCLILLIILSVLLVVIVLFILHRSKFSIKVKEINFKGFSILVNRHVAEMAYKIYIHLKTRKLAIVVTDDDVIIDVYSSWYRAFTELRELLLEIEPTKKNMDFIELTLSILNEGMRPHLTKWQAKFHRWYNNEIKRTNELTPQEIQRKYPQYEKLMDELKEASKEISKYIQELENIFIGEDK